MSAMKRFADQAAIVTGAGSGIGREVARFLGDCGARVLAVDLNSNMLEETCAARSTVVPCLCDITEVTAPADVMNACRHAFGRGPSILVNNVGVGNAHSVEDTEDEDWDLYLNINLRTVFRMSRQALAVFEGPAVIVNIASIFGLVGVQGSAPYSAAKAAVIGLTRQMAADYGPRNIRVNAVAPGLIETPATRDRIASNEHLQEILIRGTPLGRVGTPLDVAKAVAFLCSDEAAFITGQVLAVDGGWSTTRFRPR